MPAVEKKAKSDPINNNSKKRVISGKGASPRIPTNTSIPPTLRTPIPAKYIAEPYTMAVTTVTPSPAASDNSQSIFGWGMPAEVAFFIALSLLGVCLPMALFLIMRKRRLQARKALEEAASDISMETEIGNGTSTRPTTAGSWLEMLKHRTETPSPPHANGTDDGEIYYEPPKPLNFARLKFSPRRSGRISAAEIEREIRELDEEVRRRSKLNKVARQEGVIPDVDDPCGECALAYTHDERGHTQPVEGRKATPVPFLGSVEIDGTSFKLIDKSDDEVEVPIFYTESVHVDSPRSERREKSEADP